MQTLQPHSSPDKSESPAEQDLQVIHMHVNVLRSARPQCGLKLVLLEKIFNFEVINQTNGISIKVPAQIGSE